MTIPSQTVCRSVVRLALGALAAGLIGCRTGAPGAPAGTAAQAAARAAPAEPLAAIALGPADAIRGRLVLSATLAPAARIAAQSSALTRRLGVPFDIDQVLLEELAGGLGGATIPRAALEDVDPARAIVGVGILGATGVRVEMCVAIPFRDDAAARRALDAIGLDQMRRDGISGRRLADGKLVWAALGQRTLFLSRSREVIAAGGGLALEIAARAVAGSSPEVATFELSPRPFGPSLPLIVQVAAQQGVRQMADHPKPGEAKPSPATVAMLEDLARLFVLSVGQTDLVRLVVEANENAGLAVRLQWTPTAGSAFAREVAAGGPYSLDGRLPVGDDRVTVAAWGGTGPLSALFGHLANNGGPSGKPFGVALDRLVERLGGAVSCAMRWKMPAESYCVWPLKTSAQAAQTLDRYAELLRTSTGWTEAITGHPTGVAKIRRRGEVVEIDEPVGFDPRPSAKAARQALFGGDTRHTAATIKNGQLLTAQGAQPRDLLATFGGPQSSAAGPGPLLQGALARTAGAHALLFVDVPSIFIRLTDGASDPGLQQLHVMLTSVPGITDLRAPLVLSLRNREGLELELEAPTATLENVARVARPFMGVMGGGP